MLKRLKIHFNAKKTPYPQCMSPAKIKDLLSDVLDLLESGGWYDLKTDLTQDGDKAIHVAVYTGDIEVVAKILKFGNQQVEFRNKNLETALHTAACRMDLSLINILIDAGANVNAADCNGWTALHHLAFTSLEKSQEENFDIVKRLMENGADQTLKVSKGMTPLDFAYHRKNSNAIIALIKYGSLSTCQDTHRFVDQAIKKPSAEMLNFVLTSGCKLSEVSGKQPVFYKAWTKKDHDAILLLILHGQRFPFTELDISFETVMKATLAERCPSLQDLSTNAIRDNMIELSQGFSILNRVKQLQLPKGLKLRILAPNHMAVQVTDPKLEDSEFCFLETEICDAEQENFRIRLAIGAEAQTAKPLSVAYIGETWDVCVYPIALDV